MKLNKNIKLEINGIPVNVQDMDISWEYKSSLKEPIDLSSVTLQTGTVKVKVNKRALKTLVKELEKAKAQQQKDFEDSLSKPAKPMKGLADKLRFDSKI